MSKQASAAVKAAITLANIKRAAIADALGVTVQGVSDKLSRGRWTADDLATVADLCGYQLVMIDKTGRVVSVVPPAEQQAAPKD